MAIMNTSAGRKFGAGHFLASADCVRETYQVATSHAKAVDEGFLYSAGDAVLEDGKLIGIVYEDVIYTTTETETAGAIVSLVTSGDVYADLLTIKGVAPTTEEKTALETALADKFNSYESPAIVRAFAKD